MEVTREQLAGTINDEGAVITRADLASAIRRIPPAGEFAASTGAWLYAQELLLSIVAQRNCPSCSRAGNGGGYPCNCAAPCGARYCQHPLPGGDAQAVSAEPAEPDANHAREAAQALSASMRQRQQWGEGASKDDLRSAAWELERAKVHALLDVAAAIREQTEALHLGGIRDDLGNIGHALGKLGER